MKADFNTAVSHLEKHIATKTGQYEKHERYSAGTKELSYENDSRLYQLTEYSNCTVDFECSDLIANGSLFVMLVPAPYDDFLTVMNILDKEQL